MAQAQGEHSLATLLTTLSPLLDPNPFVYAHLPPGTPPPSTQPPSGLRGLFYEAHRDAWTLILPESHAHALYPPTSPDAATRQVRASFWACRLITLDVHSSLEGVGFMAAVAGALAAARVGCNPVAGWFSDHLFVAQADAERAMDVLRRLREDAIQGRVGGA